ncbi:M23 family metallopeptidase [Arthrobacter sp. H14-L1]|uniref:M23 family metallopeptidase n=1 Tax=Arthrobacter sp. H14-L1 TaxID=2996697 RepID=UPI00226EDDA9|nr:M23 family metallopeptidase [Arthrobacter sp. H14-L1]MCY0906223.1 M23 family metallopeptidase [Arthrobacter sp. H14-L1]
MPANRQHGRRRAVSSKPAFVSRGRYSPDAAGRAKGNRGQQLGAAAVVAGLIALTALPAAHAAEHLSPSAPAGPAQAAAPALSQSVTAAADASLSFVRPGVTSEPAQESHPVPELRPAGTTQTPGHDVSPQAVPAPAAPAPASNGLQPPLTALTVTSPFGYRVNPLTGAAGELHNGIDFAGACGTAVFSAGPGVVVEAGWSQYGGGNRIVVDHGGGIKTTYNHLAGIVVRMGEQVGQGAQIGGVGTTGNSTGCHLHFEVMVNEQTVNPAPFI